MQNAQHRQGHTHYNYTRGFEGTNKILSKFGIFNFVLLFVSHPNICIIYLFVIILYYIIRK